MIAAGLILFAQIANLAVDTTLSSDDQVDLKWTLQFIPDNPIKGAGPLQVSSFHVYHDTQVFTQSTAVGLPYFDVAPGGNINVGGDFETLVGYLQGDTTYTFGVVCMAGNGEAGTMS